MSELTRKAREAFAAYTGLGRDLIDQLIAENENVYERAAYAQNNADILYHEAADAFAALNKIVSAYDAYRARGVMPAPVKYKDVVFAINAARKIIPPRFQEARSDG